MALVRMRAAAALTAALACLASTSYGETTEQGERHDRVVDQAASAAQEKSISKLSGLLKKYRGTRQEPILLAKLADLQQQSAAILFRIAHGEAHRGAGKKQLDLTRYSKTMKASIETLSSLIARYPNHDEIPHAYFLRGKGHEELGNKAAAIRDYEFLVTRYPDAEDRPAAHMSLAEFAIAAADHPRAITFLKEVEKLPHDPHFPFALYKLAWSFYNLKNIPAALGYVERHIEYYRKKSQEPDSAALATSDLALLENSFMDVVVFYFEGYEQGLEQYRLSEALSYYRKLESGPALGRMLVRLAKLLRSHGHEADLIAWKDEVLAKESQRPESLEVALITYEDQRNRRRYGPLVDTAKNMVALHAKNPKIDFKPAHQALIETAEELQKVIIKNKGADDVRPLSVTLAALYDSFTRIVEETDPRVPMAHYNLAETLFTIKDYAGATQHYRWIVEHSPWNADASLKAIGARYEVLTEKKLKASELAAVPLKNDSDRALDPLLAEWIEWVDTHAKKTKTGSPERLKNEGFYFEATRALYANRHIAAATERFRQFARENPRSNFAIPSATLVIDTLIASVEWKQVYEQALEFMDEEAWNKSEFHKRLFGVASDSFYKLIEARYEAKDYKAVIKEAGKFLQHYATSARFADCLGLAGRSALALGDKPLARGYFSRLIKDAPQAEGLADALLARAIIEEERYEFLPASRDYRAYLALPSAAKDKKAEALRRKAIALAWLSGDGQELKAVIADTRLCTEDLAEECDRYAALVQLALSEKGLEEPAAQDAFKRTKDASGENRTLWAAVGLEGAKHLAFRDRLYLLRQVASGWDDSDPLVKYTLLPYLSQSIPSAFRMSRAALRDVAPLRAHERYITRRVEVIRELENAATKVMKLPWSRIRAELMNEVAALYLDFSRDLAKLSPPKDLSSDDLASYEETIRKLVLPFEEKGQELRGKAFEIASHFLVEASVFATISEAFFAENPSQAKALKLSAPIPFPEETQGDLTLELIGRIDPTRDWRSVAAADSGTAPLFDRIRAQWIRALQAKRWPQLAFFLQEAAEKKVSDKATLSMIRGVSLAAAGARGEGFAEFDAAREELAPKYKKLATLTVLRHAVSAYSRNRAKDLLGDLQADQLSQEEQALVAAVSSYIASGAKR